MSKSEKPFWVNYLEWNIIGSRTGQDATVYEVVIKVRPSGLLGIVKARKDDQYLVSFVGSKSLSGLSGELRKRVQHEDEKWRVDRYPPT